MSEVDDNVAIEANFRRACEGLVQNTISFRDCDDALVKIETYRNADGSPRSTGDGQCFMYSCNDIDSFYVTLDKARALMVGEILTHFGTTGELPEAIDLIKSK